MMAEISDDFVEKLRNEKTIEDMRNELMSFALESKFTESFVLLEGTATPMAHIDPVFNLCLWRI